MWRKAITGIVNLIDDLLVNIADSNGI